MFVLTVGAPVHYLLIVHEKQIRVHVNLFAKGKFAKVAFEDERVVLKASLLDRGVDQTALIVLVSTGDLLVYSLPDLVLLKTSSVFAHTDETQVRGLVVSKHGKAVMLSGRYEIQRHTFWADLTKMDWTKFLGVPHVEGLVIPEPVVSSLSNLFGLLKAPSVADLGPLCEFFSLPLFALS